MKAKQFFFVMLGIVVISIAAIIWSFYWGNQKLEAKAGQMADLIAERDAQRDIILKLKQAEVDSQEGEEVAGLLNRLLPKEKDQQTLVVDIIYTATAEAGIPFSKVTSFSFSGASEPDALSGTQPYKAIPGVYEYPFNLGISDISYDALLKLLNEIELNGRVIQVDNVQISPNKQNPGQLASVNLSMKAYLQP